MDDILSLRQAVSKDPNNLDLRLAILRWYAHHGPFTNSPRRIDHVLWVIEHHPDASLGLGVDIELDPATTPDAYTKARRMWNDHLGGRWKNSQQVAQNAILFFVEHDPTLAEELLASRPGLLVGNPDFTRHLALTQAFRAERELNQRVRRAMAAKAQQYYEAYCRALSDGKGRLGGVLSLAWTACEAGDFRRGDASAAEILSTADRHLSGELLTLVRHYAWIIRGRASLHRGDTAVAGQFLLEATRVSAADLSRLVVDPDLILARDLLRQGQRAAPIEYLRRMALQLGSDSEVGKWYNTLISVPTAELKVNRAPVQIFFPW
jgi:hypothetical protein